jgi:5'-deoxynucleotidase YfbR-like HD superfamily hydrolase
MGMVGAPTASGGGVRDAALKMAMDRAAKQKKKNKDKKEEEKTEYDKATEGKSDAIPREVGSTFRQLLDSGEKEKFKYSNTKPDGSIETLEYEHCIPGGLLNPKGIKCTEQKI